jgi:hypothetical protein
MCIIIHGQHDYILVKNQLKFYFPYSRTPTGLGPPHCRGFTITLRHTTLCRTSLDEWSARYRDLYLTDIFAPGGIQTRNHWKGAAADPPLRPRGHWVRLNEIPQENWSLKRRSITRSEFFFSDEVPRCVDKEQDRHVKCKYAI